MPETGSIQETSSSPKTVDWTIDDYFLLPKRIGYMIASPKFYFQDRSCRLVAFPNGTESLPDVMMLTLTGVGKVGTVRWELEIRRMAENFLRRYSGCKRDGFDMDMSMLIPVKEVEKGCYMRYRNYVTFTCSLHIEDDMSTAEREKRYIEIGSQTETTSRIDQLSCDLEELLLGGEDSNVTFRVDGQEFKAHKSILGARTPFFASMFKHKMSESITGIVDIDDCDAIAFKEFLRYIYSGKAQISPNNVFNLYRVADKYQVDELKAYGLEYIKSNLSVDAFCDVIVLSAQYEEEELMDLAIEFLSANMTEIMDTEKWQILLSEHPTDANKFLLEALNLQKQRRE